MALVTSNFQMIRTSISRFFHKIAYNKRIPIKVNYSKYVWPTGFGTSIELGSTVEMVVAVAYNNHVPEITKIDYFHGNDIIFATSNMIVK